MTDDEAEGFINGIELLRDGDGKVLAGNISNPSEGDLQKPRMTPPRKKRVLSFGGSFT
jgi:hypothetical protein